MLTFKSEKMLSQIRDHALLMFKTQFTDLVLNLNTSVEKKGLNHTNNYKKKEDFSDIVIQKFYYKNHLCFKKRLPHLLFTEKIYDEL